jgi:glutathione S-transferase
MKLHHTSTSPYVRKVMVTAHETGLIDRIEIIPTPVWDPKTDISGVNPLGKVPTLVTDDGTLLFDSPVICEYLDSLHDGEKLLPAAGPARWTALRRQALGDGLLDAGVGLLLEGRRPEEIQSEFWLTRFGGALSRGLDSLEREAEALAGPITLGHVAIGCLLGWIEFRQVGGDWRDGRPQLVSWYETFSARPSMTATIPHE